MFLDPPGLLDPTLLPHWPYAEAVDQGLTGRGIPPGTVRIERTYRTHSVCEVTMYLTFAWDVSRCAGPGGIQLTWHEETGWSHALLRPHAGSVPRGPLAGLRRVYAAPEAVTDVADALVSRRFHHYTRQWHEEWDRAPEVRTAVDAFRQSLHFP
ncbi:hypothetical protein ACH4Y0_34430 [Streptomyces sp. NPDC020707]|uniref:hypothetical protein n=1 Tax=Streptomyces sp. NPDC020707 TaxID=3365084 RepID=UPI00378C5381